MMTKKKRATKMGIKDFDRIYKLEDLASGDVMFAATGVTTGTFLQGVNFFKNGCETHSVVMRSATGTIRHMTARHRFDIKPAIWGNYTSSVSIKI
jgi:fructose-1,6-bisphosphatase II